jgi:hypothetical protein
LYAMSKAGTAGDPVVFDSSVKESSVEQEKGKFDFFRLTIHRDYKDSSESNPHLEVALRLFGKQPYAPPFEIVELRGDPVALTLPVVTVWHPVMVVPWPTTSETGDQDTDEGGEADECMYDYREQGMIVDWERARDLFKRLGI